MFSVEARITSLGLKLPVVPPEPKGNYIPFVRSGNMVYIAGHLPQHLDKTLVRGRLGDNMTLEEGKAAARLAGINLIATMRAAVKGDLEKVRRIVKVVGFVSSSNDFEGQATVVNGCSDLLAEVFLEKGSHARSAIATNVLPLGVPVEIEAIIEVDD
jgi:enamine deaminase RidA (YjgF/YER057c/UK114 family)